MGKSGKSITLLCLIIALLGLLPVTVKAEQPSSFHNALSLQGYTGILNTPNAHVTEEGSFYGLYTNQQEEQWRSQIHFEDNYMFSLGFLKFVEIGGRFSEAPDIARHISGLVKFTTEPFTRDYPWIPVFALGTQDVGGTKLLRTNYLAASEDIWRFRLSAGYGTGPERMKGVFGGAEFKAHDWVYLLGENDTKETNVGVRVIVPPFWKIPVSFTATAKTSLNYKPGNFDIAVGLTMPLDLRSKKVAQVAGSEEAGANLEPPSANVPAPETAPKLESRASDVQPGASNVKPQPLSLPSLRDRLIREGFLNVRVGTEGRTLVVEYENTVFNHNELDALGLVAGLASGAAPEGLDTLSVVIKRRNIRLATVSMPLNYLRSFLERPEGGQDLRDHLSVDFDTSRPGKVDYIQGDDNAGFLNTSLTLAPGLTTFIGTEVGEFDYLLLLQPELTTMLWKGALATARWDLPVAWSKNLDDGQAFRGYRSPAQMSRLMLFQAVKPLPSLLLNLGAGMIVHDRYGMLNEAIWSPGDGDHRFRVAQGWNEDGTTHQKANLMLGSYRYYYSPLDLSLEGAAGKFWAEDTGFSLELKRFFTDTAVSLYYKNTKGTDDKRWQAVGIQFSFPLTPSRDMKPLAKVQVRGSSEWTYAQETTIQNNNVNSQRGSLNYIPSYPLAINPQISVDLQQTFYNRDRLSSVYIKQHLERLREAWLKYGEE